MGHRLVPPAHDLECYTCPHCEAYAQMHGSEGHSLDAFSRVNDDFIFHVCTSCEGTIAWFAGRRVFDEAKRAHVREHPPILIYPVASSLPPAPEDLPEDACAAYEEARAVASQSQIAALALLRVCLEQFCRSSEVGCGSTNLEGMLRELADRPGINREVFLRLSTLRVVANGALHDMFEMPEEEVHQRLSLFAQAIHQATQALITSPRQWLELEAGLPAKQAKSLERAKAVFDKKAAE